MTLPYSGYANKRSFTAEKPSQNECRRNRRHFVLESILVLTLLVGDAAAGLAGGLAGGLALAAAAVLGALAQVPGLDGLDVLHRYSLQCIEFTVPVYHTGQSLSITFFIQIIYLSVCRLELLVLRKTIIYRKDLQCARQTSPCDNHLSVTGGSFCWCESNINVTVQSYPKSLTERIVSSSIHCRGGSLTLPPAERF